MRNELRIIIEDLIAPATVLSEVEGILDRLEETIEDASSCSRDEGYDNGYQEGYDTGHDEGYDECNRQNWGE